MEINFDNIKNIYHLIVLLTAPSFISAFIKLINFVVVKLTSLFEIRKS